MAKGKGPYSVVCLTNGCQFLRAGLNKLNANQSATSHLQVAGHNVSIVDTRKSKED